MKINCHRSMRFRLTFLMPLVVTTLLGPVSVRTDAQQKKQAVDKKATQAEESADKPSPSTSKNSTSSEEKSPDRFDPQKADGVLNLIAPSLTKILKFQRKGEKLKLDVPESYSEADAAFREIRTKARGGGGGHGSGTFWTQYVNGQSFGGRIQRSEQNFGGGRKPSPDSLTVEFMESVDDSGSLEVQAENAEDFSIRINGGLQNYYLQIIQSKNGFCVQEVNGNQSFAAKAPSFELFCRQNPDFVQTKLLATMKHYGLASPITRFNSVTRDHVLAILSPADSDAMTKFQESFQGLESTKYEEREAASKKLNDEFEKWKDVLRFAANSDKFSIEVRSRLQKLIKEKSSESDRQLIALVAASDLPNDTEYLVWLLGQEIDDQQKTNLARQLKKITGKDLGTELVAWQEFLSKFQTEKNSAKDESAVIPSLIDVEGYLPQMAEPTANLLRLTTSEGQLRLDRKFWADQFNGESIKTLVTRLQNQLEKSNLPKRWLNSGGGFGLDYVFHEHVLFEHIQTVIPPQMSTNYYSYGNLSGYRNSSINRKVEQPHLMMQFTLEKLTSKDKFVRLGPIKNKPDHFRYSVRERRDTSMELTFVEAKDNSLYLTIASPEAETVFNLSQSADGAVTCSYLVGGQNKSVSGKNFEQLFASQREYVTSVVHPIFARFGIQIPKQLGGPLKIVNAPRPKKKS